MPLLDDQQSERLASLKQPFDMDGLDLWFELSHALDALEWLIKRVTAEAGEIDAKTADLRSQILSFAEKICERTDISYEDELWRLYPLRRAAQRALAQLDHRVGQPVTGRASTREEFYYALDHSIDYEAKELAGSCMGAWHALELAGVLKTGAPQGEADLEEILPGAPLFWRKFDEMRGRLANSGMLHVTEQEADEMFKLQRQIRKELRATQKAMNANSSASGNQIP